MQEVDSMDSKMLIFLRHLRYDIESCRIRDRGHLIFSMDSLKWQKRTHLTLVLCCPGVIFHTQKAGGTPSSTSTVSSLAVLLWPITPWGHYLPVCYMASMPHTCQLKQIRAVQQIKPKQYNRKSNISSSCILYNNTFRKGKIFRLESQQPYYFLEMKNITTKAKTDLLVPNMMVWACFTFMNALLCTRLFLLTWMRREREIFRPSNSGP